MESTPRKTTSKPFTHADLGSARCPGRIMHKGDLFVPIETGKPWAEMSKWLWVKTNGIPFWGRCTTHFRPMAKCQNVKSCRSRKRFLSSQSWDPYQALRSLASQVDVPTIVLRTYRSKGDDARCRFQITARNRGSFPGQLANNRVLTVAPIALVCTMFYSNAFPKSIPVGFLESSTLRTGPSF